MIGIVTNNLSPSFTSFSLSPPLSTHPHLHLHLGGSDLDILFIIFVVVVVGAPRDVAAVASSSSFVSRRTLCP